MTFMIYYLSFRPSLVAQTVKRLPTMRETQVQSLDQEDLLEKEMATHSSILAWKIPWIEGPGRLQPMGSQRVRHNWETSLSLFFHSHIWDEFFHHVFAFFCLPKTDEGALVRAAKQLNFVFTGRTPDSVIIDSVSYLILFFIKAMRMQASKIK